MIRIGQPNKTVIVDVDSIAMIDKRGSEIELHFKRIEKVVHLSFDTIGEAEKIIDRIVAESAIKKISQGVEVYPPPG